MAAELIMQREFFKQRTHKITNQSVKILPTEASSSNIRHIIYELKSGDGLTPEEKNVKKKRFFYPKNNHYSIIWLMNLNGY
ncbi:hypothetical protein LLO_2137 [Legionella longbeachae NSW150]|uniref:Uncharacterized protein n=1 Tax=Legionella longbeachae serogroup 1 (strain NSW150) TaxID=661367 RepID=D3HJD7_LEGLN|nr:hypothetical protein LLO_2137 [Legionella longbeachae NSW150]